MPASSCSSASVSSSDSSLRRTVIVSISTPASRSAASILAAEGPESLSIRKLAAEVGASTMAEGLGINDKRFRGSAVFKLVDQSRPEGIEGLGGADFDAMAGLADEFRTARRQQCIDVLCGYLRLPYDPVADFMPVALV